MITNELSEPHVQAPSLSWGLLKDNNVVISFVFLGEPLPYKYQNYICASFVNCLIDNVVL